MSAKIGHNGGPAFPVQNAEFTQAYGERDRGGAS